MLLPALYSIHINKTEEPKLTKGNNGTRQCNVATQFAQADLNIKEFCDRLSEKVICQLVDSSSRDDINFAAAFCSALRLKKIMHAPYIHLNAVFSFFFFSLVCVPYNFNRIFYVTNFNVSFVFCYLANRLKTIKTYCWVLL